jgi:hypothetical protein
MLVSISARAASAIRKTLPAISVVSVAGGRGGNRRGGGRKIRKGGRVHGRGLSSRLRKVAAGGKHRRAVEAGSAGEVDPSCQPGRTSVASQRQPRRRFRFPPQGVSVGLRKRISLTAWHTSSSAKEVRFRELAPAGNERRRRKRSRRAAAPTAAVAPCPAWRSTRTAAQPQRPRGCQQPSSTGCQPGRPSCAACPAARFCQRGATPTYGRPSRRLTAAHSPTSLPSTQWPSHCRK